MKCSSSNICMLYSMSSRVLYDVTGKSLVTITGDLLLIITEGGFVKLHYRGEVIKSKKPSLCVPSLCRSLCCEFDFSKITLSFILCDHQDRFHPESDKENQFVLHRE